MKKDMSLMLQLIAIIAITGNYDKTAGKYLEGT